MNHSAKSKKEFMDELEELRQRLVKLEAKAVEREQTEAALRESERKYRELVDSSIVGVYRTNLAGKILYINEALARILEFDSPEEMMSESVITRYKNPKDREGLLEILKKDGRVENSEHNLLTKKGEIRKVLLSAVLNGDIISGMIMDITKRKRAEEALAESVENFKALAENANDAILIGAGGKGIHVYANKRAAELTGYGITELLHIGLHELVAPEEVEKVAERYTRRLEGENVPGQYETALIRKNGESFPVELSSARSVWEGKPATIAIIRDITERKQAEEALRESEERYSSLFKNNHSVMLLIDPDNADIVDANPAACSFYGWSLEELTSKKITDINLLTKEQVFEEMRRAKLEERQHFFFRHRLANKEIRDVEVYSGPISVHGRELLYSIIHDVTERKRAEEALRESEDKYRLVVDNVNDAIIVSQDGMLKYANITASKLSGYSLDELTSEPFLKFVHVDDREMVMEYHLRRLKGLEVPERYTFRLIKKDGSIGWFEVRGVSISWEDKPASINLLRDVTEHKEADEALQKYAERLKILREVDRAILTAQSLSDIAAAALSQIRSLVPTLVRASVVLFDLEKDEAKVLAVHTNGETGLGTAASFSLEEYGIAEKLHRGEVNLVNDIRTQPQPSQVDQALQAEGVSAYINVPLLYQGELIGTLNFGAEIPGGFTQENVEIAQEVAAQLAVAIQNARLLDSVTEQREELRALAVGLEELEEGERRRFAQELHDSVGQNLTALGINLNVVSNLLPANTETRIRSRLDDCLNLVEETADRIRNVMAELRPSVLDDYGLVAALRWHAERFSELTGLATVLQEEELKVQLPAAVETAIFRIAQEALNNVVKHARASRVTMQLKEVAGGIRLAITDDGVGFDTKAFRQPGRRPGWGLVTMRERATAVGGHLSVSSEPGKGTQLVVELRS